MTASATIAEGVDQLRAALASDDAFESWYGATVPRVYAYLLGRCGNDPILAEELAQQTVIAAIDQRARYDGHSDLVAWLCGIARHKLADHFRRLEREERRRIRLKVQQIEMHPMHEATPALDERAAIAEAIRSLPAAQQAVLALAVIDDLPLIEVARLMGKSTLATQSLLHRARQGFKRAYRGEAFDD